LAREDAATEPQQKSALHSVLGSLSSLWQAYLKRRYTILFYSLVFTIVASPVTAAFRLSGALVESFLAASLLAAVMPVNVGKTRSLLLAGMFALWLARPVTAWLGHPILSEVTLSAWSFIGFFCSSGCVAFRHAWYEG